MLPLTGLRCLLCHHPCWMTERSTVVFSNTPFPPQMPNIILHCDYASASNEFPSDSRKLTRR